MKLSLHLYAKLIFSLRVSTILVFTLLFSGCFESSENSSISNPKEPIYSYALFSPLSDANVTIVSVETKEVLFNGVTTQTGSFVVDINDSYPGEELILVKIKNGIESSSHSVFLGELYAYTTVKVIKEVGIKVNALTTLAFGEVSQDDSPDQILTKLSLYAKKLLRLSLNDDKEIDYRDLNQYIPANVLDKNFINPNFYEQLESSGFLDALLHGENLENFKILDIDNDGLSWEDEILLGSSVTNSDSDGDGILDKDELLLGLDPTNRDSDFDSISDFDELNGGTDPTKSDSDGDYFSDSYELEHGSDPLEADENANGILDGLDGDPLFQYQWYIKSHGDIVSNTNGVATVLGNDLDILQVYSYQRGNNSTIVQVVDTGVELLHEDLNIDTLRSYNSVNGTNDPTATRGVSSYDKISPFEIGHGTAVAGIIGAIANNGVGLRGVVPFVKIAGSNWLEEQSILELDRLWYNSQGANEILVSNNSWGAYMLKDRSYEEILRVASNELRDGKGRIFTFASGNDRKTYGNANLSYIANNRYAITVAALDHNNTYADYSNPGSNILVSAYGGALYEDGPSIATTLLMGKSYYENELGISLGAITFDDDSNRNYTYAMNGTSAATPMVSGAIALVLTSCPDLTWRDVRWLLSYTSKVIDSEDEYWVKNAAKRSHNINYGFGLIDANSMINECRSKYYTLLPPEISANISRENINVYIPDNNLTYDIAMNFKEEFVIEWVELTVDSNHPYAGDYEINLISPSGTKTEIISPNELRTAYYKGGFRFSSAAFMGEKSQGVWKVQVTDRLTLDSGTITSLDLKIYGHYRN